MRVCRFSVAARQDSKLSATRYHRRCRSQRVKGIEPSSVAWKATALPLSYTRAPTKLPRLAAAAKFFSARRDALPRVRLF
jgi:hypothetical protein